MRKKTSVHPCLWHEVTQPLHFWLGILGAEDDQWQSRQGFPGVGIWRSGEAVKSERLNGNLGRGPALSLPPFLSLPLLITQMPRGGWAGRGQIWPLTVDSLFISSVSSLRLLDCCLASTALKCPGVKMTAAVCVLKESRSRSLMLFNGVRHCICPAYKYSCESQLGLNRTHYIEITQWRPFCYVYVIMQRRFSHTHFAIHIPCN